MSYDIAIIGGGIVGAATLYKLQNRFPDKKIVLLEKENCLADHQTGHNSGVIHSGLYYKPGSLKAKNCVEGRHELVAFAKENNIAHDVCGKVVVATKESELEYLEKIYQNGVANQIEGLKKITGEEIKQYEPFVEGIAGLFVACTGIIDFRGATAKMVELSLAIQPESKLLLEHEVIDVKKESSTSTIITNKGNLEAKHLVFCAGLQADRLARKDGVNLKEQVVGFRGDYYEFCNSKNRKQDSNIFC